ncbi:MAG: TonB-dependent receptor [Polyangiaceae bacterium]|nr:TonB-dependent receptor [Polyangiaceae bacterium]MCL4749630.1 TonB-dependent receptor [Myxococcales bacterium]
MRSSRRLRFARLAALVALALTRPAGAQTDLIAPRLERDPGAAYPRQALREKVYERVEVVLILELDKDGKVERASVETPQGHGFDEAALEAAKALRFAPARRAGAPVKARIRFRYLFRPPPPGLSVRVFDAGSGKPVAGARVKVQGADRRERTLATADDGNATSRELPAGAARVSLESGEHDAQSADVTLVPGDDTEVVFRVAPAGAERGEKAEPIEVVVHGEKPAPAVKTFSREEVRQIPGAFGDPFRAIEAMPGVTPVASGLPFFYVRGAPPGNVGYFLDGVRVPYLYHVGFGPSVVHPGLVERVDLYPGGYPARFGRFAGGIVAAETTAPRPELHGEANVRLFDAGALVEAGFADGRGTALVGGRYSYTAALLSLIAPEVELAYRDYQARLSYDLSPRDRLTLFSFGAYDLLGRERNGDLTVLFGTEFYRLDLRHDHETGHGSLRTAFTLGLDRTANAFLAGEQRQITTQILGARTALEHRVDDEVLLRAGTDGSVERYSTSPAKYADPDSPETLDFEADFPPRTDLVFGVFADLVLDATRDVEVIPGARVDLYRSESGSAVAVDPRISARFAVSDDVRIIHAYGIAHQPPSFVLPIPGLTPGKLENGLQQSLQTSAGVEVDVADATTASLTLFYNAFFDMTDALGSRAQTGGGPPTGELDQRAMGRAIGAELFVKRKLTKQLGGFLSYTLSRSTRSLGNEEFPSNFDRTHVLNAALGYDLGRGWRPGGRVVFYTGTPLQPSQNEDASSPPRTTSDVERSPAFFRLDVRLEKRWVLGQSTWISFVAEVLNATLSKETFGDQEIGPITIPSVGAEMGF